MDGRKKDSKEKNVGISSSSRVLRSSARLRTEELAGNFMEQQQELVVSGNDNSTSAEVAIITESAVTKALTNAVILANLVKYLPAKKLPTLRLTCKLWNEAIIKELRQKHSQLKFSIYQESCWSCRSKADTVKPTIDAMTQFVATMKSSTKIPFSMYYILDVGLNQKCVRELFTVCGNSIESLTLHLENTNKVSLSQVGQLLFIQLPALRQLEIKTFYDDSCWKEDPRYVPQVNGSGRLPRLKSIKMPIPIPNSNLMKPFQNLLTDILRASVNLERIQLSHDEVDSDRDSPNEDSDDVEGDKGVQHDVHYNKPIILLLKREANFETLKYLNLFDITTAELKMLISLSELEENTNQLSIREFSTYSLKPNVFEQHNGAYISRFLELQADTLKDLTIGVRPYMLPENTTALIALPRMKSLIKLEIKIIDEPFGHINIEIQFDSFCISFPKLEHLTFPNSSLNDDQWNQCLNPAKAGNPHYRLQSLVVPCIENPGQLKRLAALFPGIWKLEVNLHSLDLFPELWTTWPALRSLKVKFMYKDKDVALDGYITGINMQDFYVPQKKTRSSGIKPEVREARKSVLNSNGKSKLLDLNDVKTRPGITDLKELTEFSLNVSNSGNFEFITNISCYYGFGVSGSKLRVINITDRNGITERCRADMQKVLGSDSELNFRQF